MALNYTRRPVLPAHVSEDNLVSPVRIVNGYLVEGVPEKNVEGCSRVWHASRGEAEEWNFKCGGNKFDCCGLPESTSKDIVDLLPSDPFGMDIKTTFTAITGWLQDLEVDSGGYVRSSSAQASQESCGLFTGWDFICSSSPKFQLSHRNVQFNEKLNVDMQFLPRNLQFYEKPLTNVKYFPSGALLDEKLNVANVVNKHVLERGFVDSPSPCDIGIQQTCNVQDLVGFSDGSTSCSSELQFQEKVEGAANPGAPHEALAFALCYLGVRDLLSVERVCRSLFSIVRGDPLLWMSIHIDQPLSERITDNVLCHLASRAQGNLQCLSLVECPKITDDGLRHILETNPRLAKLCIPGCTRISIEFVVNIIKEYNSNKDGGGIKHLRIGGLYDVTHEHFQELKILLGADNQERGSCHKPHFYRRRNLYLPYDDDRAIDIEMCPRCKKFKLVYDCPAEGCQLKNEPSQVCRACSICIARCDQCGRCIGNSEFVETFCLELLCSGCDDQLKQVPRQAG